MKKIILLLVLLTIAVLFSCKKDNSGKITVIQGKWSVKKDSIRSGIGPFIQSVNYIGTAGDYFDFRTDSKLYIKEGATLDTFAYKLNTDSTITVSYISPKTDLIFPLKGLYLSAGTNSATLTLNPALVSPGSYYSRVVSLTR